MYSGRARRRALFEKRFHDDTASQCMNGHLHNHLATLAHGPNVVGVLSPSMRVRVVPDTQSDHIQEMYMNITTNARSFRSDGTVPSSELDLLSLLYHNRGHIEPASLTMKIQ